jgi:hypothetical protein
MRKEHVVEKTAAVEDLIDQLRIIQKKADDLATGATPTQAAARRGSGEGPRVASEITGREK